MKKEPNIKCYHCLHEWHYRGKKKDRCMCPKCWGYVNIKTWRLYLFLTEEKEPETGTIQRRNHDDRIRQILFNTNQVKDKVSWWNWY